eukprot:TRINITY_DN2486_c1_g1_i10.p1 TRINITY_DN2486_c1_g1~~TRINITY_DN2486_c1_g1_i10.p1  ORF type:complete len:482 (+),score=78.21 TRINITY_DN2486_c1_g1_i10:64-1509(+)
MYFVVNACADINGQKINLKIPFASLPTILELMQRITEFYDYESKAMKSPTVFQISRTQFFNDSLVRWEDLTTMDQLRPGSQLYCHQPNIMDIQADLPQAVRAQHPMGGCVGPPSTCSPSRTDFTALNKYGHVDLETKLQYVFQKLDTNKKGFLDYGDLERGYKQLRLGLSDNTVGEMFHKADYNRDGRIEMSEWINWGLVYPNVASIMYYRSCDVDKEGIDSNKDLKSLPSAADGDHEKEKAEEEDQPTAAAQRKYLTEASEMTLIEQEIRMERTRDQMRAQEARLAEAQSLYNAACYEVGSSRRAEQGLLSTIPPVSVVPSPPSAPPALELPPRLDYSTMPSRDKIDIPPYSDHGSIQTTSPSPLSKASDSKRIALEAINIILQRSANSVVLGRTVTTLVNLLRPSEWILLSEPHRDVTPLVKKALLIEDHQGTSSYECGSPIKKKTDVNANSNSKAKKTNTKKERKGSLFSKLTGCIKP